jgi:hypothetical protein
LTFDGAFPARQERDERRWFSFILCLLYSAPVRRCACRMLYAAERRPCLGQHRSPRRHYGEVYSRRMAEMIGGRACACVYAHACVHACVCLCVR